MERTVILTKRIMENSGELIKVFNMPLISVKLAKGRNIEQKQDLILSIRSSRSMCKSYEF